ncbi:NADH dehydrogenase [ubiquinone] 1 alpha subcomplex subunit 2 [Microplitis mediator]|uniref:NADH dehydrogenase [ubiquinone] 1 alpha subcomplex subunit 2 n=1 Tax=Microplitis demolitor TaxID=69319 RepID=UPI0004CD0677|nr:NADH dehydrogenase [ubiquinone] 1 alpha subcomplex subunit 2 [Microplitis demolitor]XP_057331939.1 NADH dehydrogenase [ubiquinone] 1 alpha subcomplex subunit 2 [Microplitis mediator]
MAAVKFGPHLKELRILLCQTSKSSQGVREFIEKEYVPLKLSNPKFPVLIRECSSIEPRLYARYEFGKEASVSLDNLKPDQILQKVKQLAASKP